jgi:hypothetical protein
MGVRRWVGSVSRVPMPDASISLAPEAPRSPGGRSGCPDGQPAPLELERALHRAQSRLSAAVNCDPRDLCREEHRPIFLGSTILQEPKQGPEAGCWLSFLGANSSWPTVDSAWFRFALAFSNGRCRLRCCGEDQLSQGREWIETGQDTHATTLRRGNGIADAVWSLRPHRARPCRAAARRRAPCCAATRRERTSPGATHAARSCAGAAGRISAPVGGSRRRSCRRRPAAAGAAAGAARARRTRRRRRRAPLAGAAIQ